MKCGLLGRKLGHSYSPSIHTHLGNYSYELFEKEPEELADFLQYGDFSGINVTMPYKKAVIPYLDLLSPEAQKLGAVNTIVRWNGKLIGHNTDYYGFQSLIGCNGIHPSGKKCLVLGSGGASNVAVAVLEEMGANVVIISRNCENNYGNLSNHADAAIIVNTTPLGMYPSTGVSPVDLDIFPQLEGVVDVVYNPGKTQLLLDAEQHNIKAIGGLWMLVAQAKAASEWFTGKAIAESVIDAIYTILKAEMVNIVLIGMPGCGKSTIGKMLAEKCGKQFVDADAQIEALAKKSIPSIFSEDGESVFRVLESQVLAQLGKESGLVIATGGGCVTQGRNYDALHQNGRIFWLLRDLQKLPTAGRPLSQTQDIHKMFETRAPMYAEFADHGIDNNGTVEETINAILEVITCGS